MIPEPGRRFGPYEILGRLGGGGMGFVFRAWDSRLHREVALKLLHDEFAMPGMRERFLREARAASALSHPNICTIFDIGEQDGDPYLVMELLEGITLKERIQQGALPVDEVLSVAGEMAEALGAAHAKGIIHRDIKPANIFLVRRPNGLFQAKVLDFGLAKIESSNPLSSRTGRTLDITTAGATVGTLSYMSPEQARGEVLDSRSDLFSLGVVMYEMTTRRIPFPGATSALVFVKLLNQQPDPVRDWNDAVPRELEKIIFKLIAKERTARFQTAHELELALKQLDERGSGATGWLRKAVGTVPLVRAPEPVAARERRPVRKTGPTENEGQQPAVLDDPTPGQRQAGSDAQFLRPVARIPKADAARLPGDHSPIPNGSKAAGAAIAVESTPAQRIAVQALTSKQRQSPTSDPSAAPRASTASASLREEVGVQLAACEEPPEVTLEPQSQPRPTAGSGTRWLRTPLGLSVLVLGVGIGLAAVLLFSRGWFGPALIGGEDVIALSAIENQTKEPAFQDVAPLALEIALRQSPYLRVVRRASYDVAQRETIRETSPDRLSETKGQVLARKVAERLRAQMYLIGSIRNLQPPYVLHLDLIDTETGETKLSVESSFDSADRLPAALDEAAIGLRRKAGEAEESIRRTSVPLAQEGTANLGALHALTEAGAARSRGDTVGSLRLIEQAAALDPKFALAQRELVMAYRRLRAETAARTAAEHAVAAASDAGERTKLLAQYEYEMNVTGDYDGAIALMRQILTRYPHDGEALTWLARSLRLIGHVSEALQVAQQAYAEDPYGADAYTQAEDALIGLDRFDAAYQLDMQTQHLGVSKPGASLAAAYLDERRSSVEEAVHDLSHMSPWYAQQWNYGIYLDNIGRLEQGTQAWRELAASAAAVSELQSAAGLLLAQGAYDRALIDDCRDADSLAHEANSRPLGLTATFDSGMASALCGDADAATAAVNRLEREYPRSFAVRGYYVADIEGALALRAKDPQRALDLLQPARQFDLISLTPYLRGLAHVALHQEQIGIVDFQTVLAHRGIPFVVGNEAYPAAEIGVARAFAATGDAHNSADAYRTLLNLWKDADARQPLLLEARAHSR